MTPSPYNWILALAIVPAPFQLVGIGVYCKVSRSDPLRARRLGLFVPAGLFFGFVSIGFLWCYFQPDMMFMAAAAANFFLLVLLAAGTILNLGCSAVLMAFLARCRPAEESGPKSQGVNENDDFIR